MQITAANGADLLRRAADLLEVGVVTGFGLTLFTGAEAGAYFTGEVDFNEIAKLAVTKRNELLMQARQAAPTEQPAHERQDGANAALADRATETPLAVPIESAP